MRRNETLLELLLELQVLDRVPRMGYVLRGVPDPESITEHSWHVAFLVWALAPLVQGVDNMHALEMALIHDLAEVRLGDLPMVAARYLPDGAKERAEEVALGEVLAPLGHRHAELLAEYTAGKTAEARLVKACDKLHVMLKVETYESWGSRGLEEFWESGQNFDDRGLEPVRQLLEELRIRRKKRHEGES